MKTPRDPETPTTTPKSLAKEFSAAWGLTQEQEHHLRDLARELVRQERRFFVDALKHETWIYSAYNAPRLESAVLSRLRSAGMMPKRPKTKKDGTP